VNSKSNFTLLYNTLFTKIYINGVDIVKNILALCESLRGSATSLAKWLRTFT